MEKATEALERMNSHERLCGERYLNINASIRRIEGWLKWGGGVAFTLSAAAFTLIIALLGWSLRQQYESALQDRAASAAKITALEQQLAAKQAPVVINQPP